MLLTYHLCYTILIQLITYHEGPSQKPLRSQPRPYRHKTVFNCTGYRGFHVVHSYPPLVLIGPPVRSTDPWNTSQITHAHRFNGPLSGTTRVSRYQKGKTNLDFTEATESEWQWHPLGHTQVCTSLQTDNHTSNPPLIVFYRRDALPVAQPTESKH